MRKSGEVGDMQESKTPTEDEKRQLLDAVPLHGAIGNKSLREKLERTGWNADGFWRVRNYLIEVEGALERGRGKGGSVSRTLSQEIETVGKTSITNDREAVARKKPTGERALYQPIKRQIETIWAATNSYGDCVVIETAFGGRRRDGKWTRPDLTVLSLRSFQFIPNIHLEVITFEVKTHGVADVTAVYEALSHRRVATKSFAFLLYPQNSDKPEREAFDEKIEPILAEARRHGVGVILAESEDDAETWTEKVEPVRHVPDPQDLNDFIAQQMKKNHREISALLNYHRGSDAHGARL